MSEIEHTNIRLRCIWSAVLLQAVRDHQANLREHGLEIAQAMEPARYIRDNSNRVGGFLWVCAFLDLDPEGLRKAMNSRGIMAMVRHFNGGMTTAEERREKKLKRAA